VDELDLCDDDHPGLRDEKDHHEQDR